MRHHLKFMTANLNKKIQYSIFKTLKQFKLQNKIKQIMYEI